MDGSPRSRERWIGGTLLLVAVVLLLAALAGTATAASGDTVYVNVASGENKGCSDDDADFIVNIHHDGEKVASVPEITHHSSPLWGAVEELEGISHGDVLSFTVREGESFLWEHWRETCDLSEEDGKRGNVTWTGGQKEAVLKGQGGDAALLRVVLSSEEPPIPDVRVDDRQPDSLTLAWDDPAANVDSYVLRKPWNNGNIAKLEGNETRYEWSGLKDNKKHKIQVIRETGPWQVGAIEAFRTANAPPPQPEITKLAVRDGQLAVTWRNANIHDGDTLEIHAGPTRDFEASNDTLRAEDDYKHGRFAADRTRKTTEGVVLEDGDEFLKVRAIDTEGAANVSEATPVLGPPEIEDVYVNDEGLTVRWTHHRSTLDRFEIHTGDSEDFELSASTERTRVSDPGGGHYERTGLAVPAGHDYVVVRAVDRNGNRTPSAPAELVEDPPPPTPWNLGASKEGEEIVVGWTAELPDDVARAEVIAGEAIEASALETRANVTDLDLDRREHTMVVDDVEVGENLALRLVDERGQTSTSEIVPVKDGVPPPKPRIEEVLDRDGLSIAWRHEVPDDLARYNVYALERASGRASQDARVAVITDWPEESQPMTARGVEHPEETSYVLLEAVDEAGNKARADPALIQDPSEVLATPSVLWAVRTDEGLEMAWRVSDTEGIEAFRVHASSTSPTDEGELEARGSKIPAGSATDYVRVGWPSEATDRYVVVEAIGAQDASSLSPPENVAEGYEAVPADPGDLRSGSLDAADDEGQPLAAQQLHAERDQRSSIPTEDPSGTPWLGWAILAVLGLTGAFVYALVGNDD